MSEKLINLVEEAIEGSITRARSFNSESEKESRNAEIDNIVKLVKARNDLFKPADDFDAREMEAKQKESELKQAKKEMWIKLGLGAAQLSAPLVAYGIWLLMLMCFEEKGQTPTFAVFKNFMKELRPKM